MGKKKSVVLLTLITIVIVVLCAVALFPSFPLSVFKEDSVKEWTPVVSQYDLDEELGGGYTARYYPSGVISKAEFDSNCISIEEQEPSELEEYKSSYQQHGGVYLSKTEEDHVMKKDGENYVVDPAFDAWFKETAELIGKNRFAKMQYSTVNISVCDDYVLEVNVPSSGSSSSALQAFAYTGDLTVSDGTDEYPGKTEAATDYFKSFTVGTSGVYTYIEIKATDLGSEKLTDFNEKSSTSTISFKIGDETLISPQGSNILNVDGNTWQIGITNQEAANIFAIALNSALHFEGSSSFVFDQEKTEIATYEPVYGKNGKTMLYLAALIALAVAVILPIILYKGFGVAMAYGMMTYFLIVAYLYAFVTNAVFEVSAVSALLFAAGLALVFALNSRVYDKIKKEVSLGKTVDSSVKNAFKKTLLSVVDACVIAVIGSVAFLIGGAALQTVAAQAVICFAAASFVCLVWTRVINHLLLSASKDKYAFYRLKREDDDDE